MKPDASRDEILRRVRTAVANPALAADRGRPQVAGASGPHSRGLLTRWQEEFAALGGHAHGPVTLAADFGEFSRAASAQTLALLAARGVTRVTAWEDHALPVADLSLTLTAAGIEVIHTGQQTQADADFGGLSRAASRAALAQAQIGITAALAGLADSGSVVVVSGPGQARATSLVPPIYLAFLRTTDIYADLPTWMASQGAGLLARQANLTIITGPSRTADIELTLVVGVHGPGEIHVILIDPEES
jgi:L-lactate dehydrogenase complex protein LldG